MCPFNALRATRVLYSSQQQKFPQQNQQRQTSNPCLDSIVSAAISVDSNANSIALGKSIGHQSQCRVAHQSLCLENLSSDLIRANSSQISCKCIHTSTTVDAGGITHWPKTYLKCCDRALFDFQSVDGVNGSSFGCSNSKLIDQNTYEYFDSQDLTNQNVLTKAGGAVDMISHSLSPSLSSSPSRSTLSFSTEPSSLCNPCSMHTCSVLNKSAATPLSKFDASLSAFGYQLDKASEALGSSMDPVYLTNLVDSTVCLSSINQSTVIREGGALNQDMLTCYHHYHVSRCFYLYLSTLISMRSC